MSPRRASQDRRAQTSQRRGSEVVLRRHEGPRATELFLRVGAGDGAADVGAQARAAYAAIVEVLDEERTDPGTIVSETVYLRDPRREVASLVRDARERSLGACAPSVAVGQAPLDAGAELEIAVQAVVPKAEALRLERVRLPASLDCGESALCTATTLGLGDELRCYAGALAGRGRDGTEQTLATFEAAEVLLQHVGMDFGDVARTWIHLRHMERDYAAFNRGRRIFFERRGVEPAPASTGIGGAPLSPEHDLCLGFYALRAASAVPRTVMTSPTLNEARVYGADFVRGMRVEDANKLALHVSGTASIDERGETAHPADLEGQIDRMLSNVEALLREQRAGFEDIVSGVTYLKRAQDAETLRRKLQEAGCDDFPNVLVAAEICRPELLCEIEVLALRSRT